VNYAVTEAMNGMGADAGKWTWLTPAFPDISPHAKFVWNLSQMFRETPEGRDSRRQVFEYMKDFIPASTEFHNIFDAVESTQGLFDDDGNPQKPRDLEQDLLYEMGYSETKAGDIRPTLTERERQPVQ
jgi:hypothetical protein